MGALGKLGRAMRKHAKEEEDAIASTPLFRRLERVFKALKAFYAENGWILMDKEAVAVLEAERKEYENGEEKLQEKIDGLKKDEHNRIEKHYDELHDIRLLKLQLLTAEREYRTCQRLATIHLKAHKPNG